MCVTFGARLRLPQRGLQGRTGGRFVSCVVRAGHPPMSL
jgi:hypothetical protein